MQHPDCTAEFSICKARRAQLCMAKKVIAEDTGPNNIQIVAGVDAAYYEDWAVGAIAVLDYESLEILETETVTQQVKFPYIPTLLSFRELPPAMACIRKLKLQPDVFLVDGHGKAHPYKCGFACHLGLTLRKPTIGVAKSRLVGEVNRINNEDLVVLNGEVIGAEVTTMSRSKPVHVSVGHMISLQRAVKIVKDCCLENRIPEPIRQAHRLASEERKLKMGELAK